MHWSVRFAQRGRFWHTCDLALARTIRKKSSYLTGVVTTRRACNPCWCLCKAVIAAACIGSTIQNKNPGNKNMSFTTSAFAHTHIFSSSKHIFKCYVHFSAFISLDIFRRFFFSSLFLCSPALLQGVVSFEAFVRNTTVCVFDGMSCKSIISKRVLTTIAAQLCV